ncbi:hypothetical protein EJB05_39784, partial [Eragrostis curvula]
MDSNRSKNHLNLLLSFVLLLSPRSTLAVDTFSKGRNITDNNTTLVSADGAFTMGFFSPGVSTKRYLGIWFTVSRDAVCWVANGDHPINDNSGVLFVSDTENLLLLDGTGQVAWSSNSASTSPVEAQLLNSGDLVVRNQGSTDALWHSFNFPQNVFLSGMKVGKDFFSGAEWYLTSWRSPDDPSPGAYTRRLDIAGLPDNIVWQGNVKTFRSDPWNGVKFGGIPEVRSYMGGLFDYQMVISSREITYGYQVRPGATYTYIMLRDDGKARRLAWDASSRTWQEYYRGPRDVCDDYGKCGAFGVCNISAAETLYCSCLTGYSPASPLVWPRITSDGCRRNVKRCGQTSDGFWPVRSVKLPDTHNATVDTNITVDGCRARCLSDCSCLAYAAAEVRAGGNFSGCVMWSDDLIDLRYIDSGQDLYLRLTESELPPASPPPPSPPPSAKSLSTATVASASVASIVGITLIALLILCVIKRRRRSASSSSRRPPTAVHSVELTVPPPVPFAELSSLKEATGDFSESNIIGRGGFGIVYEGHFPDGRKVAVKRLNQSSPDDERGDDFMREVEVMSKLRGYTAPEYIMECRLLTLKCDVYSFGVILLEVVSGKRNWNTPTLLPDAWESWNQHKINELLDSAVTQPEPELLLELEKCVQVGLLCVQQSADDRPTMSAVVTMLNNTSLIHRPKKPVLFDSRNGSPLREAADLTVEEASGRSRDSQTLGQERENISHGDHQPRLLNDFLLDRSWYADMFPYESTSMQPRRGDVRVRRAKAGAPLSRLLHTDAGVVQRLVWGADMHTRVAHLLPGPQGRRQRLRKCGAFGVHVVLRLRQGVRPRVPRGVEDEMREASDDDDGWVPAAARGEAPQHEQRGLRETEALDCLWLAQHGGGSSSVCNRSNRIQKQFWSFPCTRKGQDKCYHGAQHANTDTYSRRFPRVAADKFSGHKEEARRLGHNFVGTEQILLGLIGEGTGIAAKVLKSMGINLKDARVEVEKIIGRGSGFVAVEIPFTPRAKRVLELSLEEARQLGHNYIGSEHLLLGLLREGEGVAARVLESLGADPNNIRGGTSGQKMPTLEEYGTNLTKLAEEGKLDPVVGRQDQIERVTQILGRRTKNNPCLIGEPGVGKTAIAEGLAQRIANGDVPETIEGKKVITLDMGLLVAGTKYRGEFEERLKKLMEEIKQNEDIILFIDEVHTLIGAGAAEGAIDAANILKPALARGELQCIGATTLDEYRKHIEKDPALERRFQPVKVPEPTVDESIQILRGLRERYELHHKLRYTDDALIAAAQLSYQYISDRFLPDKAIDLIDEAGSRVRLRHAQLPDEAKELDKELRQITKQKNEAVRGQDFEKVCPNFKVYEKCSEFWTKAGELRDREMELKAQITAIIDKSKEMIKAETESGEVGPLVTEADIQHIVSSWTGIPVEKVSSDESDRLLKMEETLHTRIIGQDEAVKAISRAIRRARVGLKNPNRPIASFIFSGPTGVGKSELAKALASYYFGSEEAMIRLDMSEFMERHTVSKLIGSPPGYVGYTEGGQLTEAVRRRPYTVVLFDEIEKAHPDVFNMMLQILEDGRLTDSKGRTVDFKNTLLIMTSNVGSSVIEKGGRKIGFDLDYDEKDTSYNRIKSLVTEELKQYFRPEFLNRLDEMIVFRQLTKLEVKEIADIMLKEVFDRLKAKEIDLQVTERFRDRVVDEGYNPSYGARPLRRAIMRLLEDSLAEKILAGEVKEGDSAIVDVDSEGKVIVLNGGSGVAEPLEPALSI